MTFFENQRQGKVRNIFPKVQGIITNCDLSDVCPSRGIKIYELERKFNDIYLCFIGNF